jgi:hypothetical protein
VHALYLICLLPKLWVIEQCYWFPICLQSWQTVLLTRTWFSICYYEFDCKYYYHYAILYLYVLYLIWVFPSCDVSFLGFISSLPQIAWDLRLFFFE